MKDRIWRASWNRFAAALAPALLLVLSSLPARSQTTSDILNPLFQGILAQPSNFNNALQYATLAPSSDIESAISTYEQLLFYNPNLAGVRFELGVLYYRLGSYEMARGYFASALKMKDMTPALRQRTEDLIAAIDKQLKPDQFSGYVQSGLRYQTNAALGPTAGTVLASGRLFNNKFAARPDWNWFGAFGLNYVHDFEDQNGNTFEASALGYDAQQFKLHQFDVGDDVLAALPQRRRQILHLQRRGEISARHFVGAEPVIQHAELEAHAGEVRIVEQQLFVGADGGFDVAGRRQRGILQGVVEIRRLRQDALEQRIQKIGRGLRFRRQARSGKHQRRRQCTRNSSPRCAPSAVFHVATCSTMSPAGFGSFALLVLSSARCPQPLCNLAPRPG